MFVIARDIIRESVKEFPEIKPYLSKKALKAIGGFESTHANYYLAVYQAVSGYLSGSGYVTAYRNQMASAMAEAFTDAVYTGYQEAGAELPLDEETSAWLGQRIAAERGFIDSMFANLKVFRSGITKEQIEAEASSRAQGYSNTLDVVYQEARMRGSKNITLVFAGTGGKRPCSTCRSLQGKRHRISWIIEKGMIPGPGNTNFICNGYNCHHYWMNPVTGETYTF